MSPIPNGCKYGSSVKVPVTDIAMEIDEIWIQVAGLLG
jgi:hypothetical protein